jgi:hypothetical protein
VQPQLAQANTALEGTVANMVKRSLVCDFIMFLNEARQAELRQAVMSSCQLQLQQLGQTDKLTFLRLALGVAIHAKTIVVFSQVARV